MLRDVVLQAPSPSMTCLSAVQVLRAHRRRRCARCEPCKVVRSESRRAIMIHVKFQGLHACARSLYDLRFGQKSRIALGMFAKVAEAKSPCSASISRCWSPTVRHPVCRHCRRKETPPDRSDDRAGPQNVHRPRHQKGNAQHIAGTTSLAQSGAE